MHEFVVKTPRGTVVKTPGGRAEIKWNPNFSSKFENAFSKTQKVVDSEVLRVTEPYIPLVTSALIKSGILGTTIGSGEVKWIAPYARKVYYANTPIGRETGPLRGNRWFDRAMKDHKEGIVKRAGAKFGGSIK